MCLIFESTEKRMSYFYLDYFILAQKFNSFSSMVYGRSGGGGNGRVLFCSIPYAQTPDNHFRLFHLLKIFIVLPRMVEVQKKAEGAYYGLVDTCKVICSVEEILPSHHMDSSLFLVIAV